MDNDKIVPAGEILVYQTEDGKTRVECRFEQETVWLSQALIGELFQVSVPTVNEHLKNIFGEAELAPEATIRKFRIVRREGQREVSRLIEHYNLCGERGRECLRCIENGRIEEGSRSQNYFGPSCR
jgi:hypothetical protein